MIRNIKLSNEAQKTLERLDRITEARILKRLRALAQDPFNPRLPKRLIGAGNLRSSRVGDWRILFVVDGDGETLFVVAIRPRGQAYRRLD
ncbi:MAG: type II toxin-antitoxin system RelE/ParE family toxin [Hydrogenibacillus schlegelii]|nr:type II toxin-antitoxin system RelE/ParE family toxin [Hydrogenibacillus schlegelii]